MCSERLTVNFADIASSIQIPENEVEMWVIDVIRVGLIEAKVDQVQSQVVVSRSTHGMFKDSHWADLKTKLVAWQKNISQVQRVLTNVRMQMEEAGR